MKLTERERFLLKVVVRPGCWMFQAAVRHRKLPYKVFVLSNGRNEYAHRYMWTIAHRRSIPKGKVIRHACDNPKCVNPDHLILGSYKENTQDAVRRRRIAHGRRSASSKLAPEEVKRIRKSWKAGITQTFLAKEFGVSQAAISKVCRGEHWRWT